jgi:hypothetical protein
MDNRRYRDLVFAGKDQFAQTPDEVIDLIQRMFAGREKIFDPAPPKPKFDGLSIPWKRFNYVNPPYSDVADWVQKACAEAERGNCSLLFVPARTHTKYFFADVFPRATYIILLHNRIVFKGYAAPLPTPIMMAVFGKPPVHRLKQPGVSTTTLPATMLRVSSKPKSFRNEVVPAFQGIFGKFDHIDYGSSSPNTSRWGAKNLICVMAMHAEHAAAIAEWSDKHPTGVVVLMQLNSFHTAYMCRLVVPRSKHVFFFHRCVTFDGFDTPSSVGTSAFVVGKWVAPKSLPSRKIVFMTHGDCGRWFPDSRREKHDKA